MSFKYNNEQKKNENEQEKKNQEWKISRRNI